MKHICTYFDSNFLPRGLALLDSLEKNSDNFLYYVLALDEKAEHELKALNNKHIVVITLEDYSSYYSIDRSKFKDEKEFYFSLTPGLCLYVLKKYNDINMILYLDADVYLFNDLEIVYDEIGDSSIAMCSHRLPWYINLISKNYGIYNVGVNAFRNDKEGVKCLQDWHHDCTNWSAGQEDYPLSFFSDQIWLDKWPKKYNNLKIISHIGINVAPWNAINYKFSKKGGKYFVNNKPLVIYHFSSLKKLSSSRWHGNTSFTIHNISGVLLEIYKEYIRNIEKYDYNTNHKTMKLEFEGSKIKMLIYLLLKQFHNHTIELEGNK